MYQLSQNEDKQEKLFAELQRALSEKNSPITSSTLDQLPYLKACIKETLRMYPVVLGNGRSLQSDAVIAGYNVPKGVNNFFVFHVSFRTGNLIFIFNLRRLMWFSRITFSRTRKATSRNQQSSFPSGGWRTKKSHRKTSIDSWVCRLDMEEERASEGDLQKLNLLFCCRRWEVFHLWLMKIMKIEGKVGKTQEVSSFNSCLPNNLRQEIKSINGNKYKIGWYFSRKHGTLLSLK